jgi:hypothetical protein
MKIVCFIDYCPYTHLVGHGMAAVSSVLSIVLLGSVQMTQHFGLQTTDGPCAGSKSSFCYTWPGSVSVIWLFLFTFIGLLAEFIVYRLHIHLIRKAGDPAEVYGDDAKYVSLAAAQKICGDGNLFLNNCLPGFEVALHCPVLATRTLCKIYDGADGAKSFKVDSEVLPYVGFTLTGHDSVMRMRDLYLFVIKINVPKILIREMNLSFIYWPINTSRTVGYPTRLMFAVAGDEEKEARRISYVNQMLEDNKSHQSDLDAPVSISGKDHELLWMA